MEIALQIVVGIAVGLGAAWIHLQLARRAARRVVDSGRARWAFVGMPVRVAVAAAFLFALGLWGVAALLAGAAAFAVGERIGIATLVREEGAP